jgi:hypothetical protein
MAIAVLNPNAVVNFTDATTFFQYLTTAPTVINLPAILFNEDSRGIIEGGRYRASNGTLRGNGTPEDTDISMDTGANVGIVFEGEVTGTDNGMWYDHTYLGGRRLLEQLDGAPGVGCTLSQKQFNKHPFIQNAEIRLTIGPCHESLTPTYATYYTYIRLRQSVIDFRIAIEQSRPVALDYTEDDGKTWKRVAQCSMMPSSETYLEKNDREMTFVVEFDPATRVLTVQLGESNNPMQCTVSQSEQKFTQNNRISFEALNGYRKFWYKPLKYTEMVVKSPPIKIADNYKLDNAFVRPMGNYAAREYNQSEEMVLNKQGSTIQPEITVKPKDMTGLSKDYIAPVISGVQIIIPAVWRVGSATDNPFGFIDNRFGTLPSFRIEETQRFDLLSRMGTTQATVHCQNPVGDYTGAYGQPAAALYATNGYSTGSVLRLTGHVGGGKTGLAFHNRRFRAVIHDRTCAMDVPIRSEMVFDGWSLYGAVRFLCEAGNIHPKYHRFSGRGLIPYTPPNATPAAPYGQASYDAPGYILGRGTGKNPKYKFSPETSCLTALLEILRDYSEIDPNPITAGLLSYAPYVLYFTPDGYLNIGPYFLSEQVAASSVHYEIENTGFRTFMEPLQVYRSTEDMRTSVVFQGYDPINGGLLHAWIEQNPDVIKAIGYNNPWIERNVRFASEEYIKLIIEAAAWRASIPTTVVRMRVPFDPSVFAGQVVRITDYKDLGGTGLFLIETIQSTYGFREGSHRKDCYSNMTLRALENLI